jgi:hypothetical protein
MHTIIGLCCQFIILMDVILRAEPLCDESPVFVCFFGFAASFVNLQVQSANSKSRSTSFVIWLRFALRFDLI